LAEQEAEAEAVAAAARSRLARILRGHSQSQVVAMDEKHFFSFFLKKKSI